MEWDKKIPLGRRGKLWSELRMHRCDKGQIVHAGSEEERFNRAVRHTQTFLFSHRLTRTDTDFFIIFAQKGLPANQIFQ